MTGVSSRRLGVSPRFYFPGGWERGRRPGPGGSGERAGAGTGGGDATRSTGKKQDSYRGFIRQTGRRQCSRRAPGPQPDNRCGCASCSAGFVRVIAQRIRATFTRHGPDSSTTPATAKLSAGAESITISSVRHPSGRIHNMPPAADQPAPPAADAVIRCAASDSFQEWLARAGGTLAVTTYQAGKVALIGWDAAAGQVTLLLRQFQKPMGLATRAGDDARPDARPRQLALATRHEVLLFADAPPLAPDYLESRRVPYDALYLPRAAYFTGDLNVHDIAFGAASGSAHHDTAGRLWL